MKIVIEQLEKLSMAELSQIIKDRSLSICLRLEALRILNNREADNLEDLKPDMWPMGRPTSPINYLT